MQANYFVVGCSLKIPWQPGFPRLLCSTQCIITRRWKRASSKFTWHPLPVGTLSLCCNSASASCHKWVSSALIFFPNSSKFSLIVNILFRAFNYRAKLVYCSCFVYGCRIAPQPSKHSSHSALYRRHPKIHLLLLEVWVPVCHISLPMFQWVVMW